MRGGEYYLKVSQNGHLLVQPPKIPLKLTMKINVVKLGSEPCHAFPLLMDKVLHDVISAILLSCLGVGCTVLYRVSRVRRLCMA